MYNLLIIANKAGVSVAMHSLEYNTHKAALEAIENLRQGLVGEAGYSVRYFLSHKGDFDES